MNISDLQRFGMMLHADPRLAVIGGGAAGVGSWLFFNGIRNAWLKRLIFPIWTFGVAAALLGLGLAVFDVPRRELPATVAAVFGIAAINMLRTRFCEHCGRTLRRQPIFRRSQPCPHCGQKPG